MKTYSNRLIALLSFVTVFSQASIHSPNNSPVQIYTIRTEGVKFSEPESTLPDSSGINQAVLTRIDSIVQDGIKSRAFPGCQVLVMKNGKPVYDKCFGTYTYEPSPKVKPSTIYDMASLSKTTGTLLAIMKLYDSGKLSLDDKASQYLTFLRGTDKQNITIKQLLFHESGLAAYLPFYKLAIDKTNPKSPVISQAEPTAANIIAGSAFRYKAGWVSRIPTVEYMAQVSDSFFLHNRFRQEAMQMIATSPLGSKTYNYSCINFIVLKEIAEAISGMTMDSFLEQEFYGPMQLASLSYLPLRKYKKEEIAPTLKKDNLRGNVVQGFVHDHAAAFMGGISGNAGLFGKAADVANVYQMLLNNGKFNDKRYLSEETCNLFTTTTSASGRRGLGFDKPVPSNPKSSPCCPQAPTAVYGHMGYTGTCSWVDPLNGLVYVFLSNRTYPDDGVNKLARMGIRTKIQEVIYQSLDNPKK